MLSEDHQHQDPTTEEPKGRALNFTMNNTGNVLSNSSYGTSDLSDVTIDEDEEEEQSNPRILAPKEAILSNLTALPRGMTS